ncbi:ribosome biogenesis protein NOP53 [Aplysia californica]|uniref:Ribosome biogenesis protein NOP53 n=1 Tax=Aplysia californica TaxID=6500 RepID=A0ABM0JUE3_APLCA|nr:ribosome biogenesis protein NOP53 [Aplysia californica]
MADINTAPKLPKNRKLGKNKKKSWRASRVQDIEEFLHDERRQLLTGGLVSEKSDESLFVLDSGINKKNDAEDATQGPRSKRARKDKALKCLSLLLPNPHSKSVRKPDDNNFQRGKRSQPVLERVQKKARSQRRVAAEAQSQKSAQVREIRRAKKRELPTVDSDLWADSDDGTPVTVKPPKRYRKKPSALNATVVPHPGASVNPAYEDHQGLLLQARVLEVGKVKKEKKVYNSLDAKFPSREDAPNESTYLEEMAAGLVDDSDEEEESDADAEEPIAINPPVRREDRKTKKQRRVEKDEEVKLKEKRAKNDVKQRENMVLRIPSIKAQLNKEDRKQQQRAAKKQVLKEQMKFRTKRLGKIKYEEPDLDLKLSTELVGSLREVLPEGHVISDVYKSLQRRNMTEPRVRQKNKRKYKPKVFEKKGHKEVTL